MRLALVWIACCFAVPAFAQETNGPAVAPRPDVFPPMRRVFVPVDELDVILAGDKRGVLLPKEEFQKLYAAAQDRRAQTPHVPRGIVLSDVTYAARIAGEQLQITARVSFRQFTDDWLTLALPLRGLAVESAQLDGEPARVGRLGKGPETLHLLNNREGLQTLELELSAHLAAVGGDRVAAFGLAPAGSGTLTLTLPAQKHLMVDGVFAPRPAQADQPADYSVAVGGRRDVTLTITDRRSGQAADSLVFAATAFGLNVAPGEISWQAATSLNVYGRAIDRLVCSVPNTLEIADVQSTGLEAWELADDPRNRRRTAITLKFRQPVEGARQIVFRGVTTEDEDGSWSVPNLTIEDVTSHVGQMLIRHPPGVRLELLDSDGVRPRDAVDVSIGWPGLDRREAPELRTPGFRETPTPATPVAAYDVWQEDFDLAFATRTKQRELMADLLTSLSVGDRGLELATIAKLRTLYAPLFELQVALPAEWTITGTTVAGNATPWETVPLEAGVHQVRIALDPPVSPGQEIPVTITAHRDLETWPPEDEAADFALPEVRLPQANVVEGAYLLKAEDDFELVPADVTGLDPVHLGLPGERAGYRYQDTRFSGRLTARIKPSHIAAQTLSFTRLDPQALVSHVELLVEIEGGGVRALGISLPEAVGEDLRFQVQNSAARIVEQQSAALAGGRRLWALRFDRRVKGSLRLSVDLQSPRGDAIEFSLHTVRVEAADRQNGFLAIEAGPEQRLQIDAVDQLNQPLAEVDPVDLPATRYVPRERIVAAYRYVLPGYAVRLSEDRFDPYAVPTAVCHHSELASIIGPTDQFQHRAEFAFVAVGVQGIRVRLPEGAALWATLLDGQPIEVRRTETAYLVPVPGTNDPQEQHSLVLFYRTPVKPLDSFGRIEQNPPMLSAQSGRGDEQPLRILDQHWTLYHPTGTLLIASDGGFEMQGEPDRSSLLSRLQQSFRVAPPNQLLWNAAYIAITALLIAAITLTYRRRGLRGLVLFTGAAGLFLLLMFALLMPATQQAREAARRTQAISELDSPRSMVTQDASGSASFGDDASAPAGMGRHAFEPADQQIVSENGGETTDDMLEREEAAETPPTEPPAAQPQGTPGIAQTERQPALDSDERLRLELQRRLHGRLVPLSAEIVAPTGARLSVAIDFQPPVGYVPREFHDLGAGDPADTAALNVVFESRDAGAVFRLIVFAVVLLVFWWLRNQPARVRAIVAPLAIAVPLALITITPVAWHVVLDGLFLGALGGVLLWGVCGVCGWCAKSAWCRRFLGVPTTTTVLLAACLLTPAYPVFAQQTAKAQPASGEMRQPMPQATAAALPLEDEPTVIIPYDANGDPLAAERVFLPHDKFLELWNQAYPDRRVKRPAPVDGLVAGAAYAAELQTDDDNEQAHVRVTGRIVLISFREHQITLPLPFGRLALAEARVDGKTAALVYDAEKPEASPAVVLDSPGSHVLDVVFDVPVELDGPAGEFEVPLAPVPAGKFSFTLPDGDLNVRVNGSDGTFRRNDQNGQSIIEIPVDRTEKLSVTWRPEQVRATADAVVHAETLHALHVTDAGLNLFSEVEFQVKLGTLSEISFSLPEALKLKQISGSDLGGWELAEDGEERTLRVFLRRDVTDLTKLRFQFYQAVELTEDADTLPFPEFAPQNVTRETGTIVVLAGSQFSVRLGETAGVRQINAGDFQIVDEFKLPDQALQFALRYSARPFELPLLASRRTPGTRITAEHGVKVGLRKQHVTSRFSVDFRNVPRSRFALLLPEGFLTLAVEATHMSDWYVSGEEGAEMLVVEFDGPRLGRETVAVKGTIPKAPDDETVDVMLPMTLIADELTTTLAVWVEDVYSPGLDEVEGWRAMGGDQLSADMRALDAELPPFAFRSTELEPFGIVLTLRRAAPRLSADSVTIVTATDVGVNYTLALGWEIEQAAADEVVFIAPDWLAGKLDFTASGMRQVTETPLGDGRVRWSVRLQTPVRGNYFLTATTTLPPPQAGPQGRIEIRTPAVEFQQRDPAAEQETYVSLDPRRSQHFVVLVNQSTAQLTPTNPGDVEAFDGELPVKVRQPVLDQAVEVVRLPRADFPPGWLVQRFDVSRGAEAAVNLAELTTVVAADGTWRTEANYRVKNRSRQFLAVAYPEGAELLSLFVGERAARPVAAPGQPLWWLVPLPKTSEADLSFPVKLVLAGKLPGGALPKGFRIAAREIDLPAPHVVSNAEHPEFGIPVARVRWTVYLPEDLDVEPVDDRARNNLSLVSAATTQLFSRLAMMREAADMFGVAEGKASAKSKYRAMSNLKSLNTSINAAVPLNEEVEGEVLRQFYEQQRDFNKQYEAVNSRLLIDEANRRAIVTETTDGTVNIWDLGEVDERALQDQFRRQAQELFMDNDGSGRRSEAVDADEEFQLKAAPDAPDKAADDTPTKGRAPASGKQSFQRQQQTREEIQKLQVNLDKLKSDIGRSFDQGAQQESQPMPQPREDAPAQPPGQGQGPATVPGRDVSTVGEGVAISQVWTAAGGLSLAIEIPKEGRQYTFTKVSGAPKLALAARPRESLTTGVGLVWTVVWLTLGIATAVALSRTGSTAVVLQHLPKALIALGLVTFFLLPAPLSWLGFAAFIVGAICVAFQHRSAA